MILNANGTVTLETTPCFCTHNENPGYQYGTKACTYCLGTGRTKGGKGKGTCRICYGSRQEMDRNAFVICSRCKGGQRVDETEYDSIPTRWFDLFTYTVDRTPRHQTLLEAYIGAGIQSTTDYGDHKKLSDTDLITKAKHQLHCQLITLLQDKRLCTHVIIRCNSQGYSLIPDWRY